MATKKETKKDKLDIKKTNDKNDEKFTVVQLLTSDKYRGKVDLLKALLCPNTCYSIKEVDTKINKFMNGEVK